MVVELEPLMALQAKIMKYGSMDKFLSNELEANICLKESYGNHDGIHECLANEVDRWGVVLTFSHL
jgi:hypothetical protein